MELNWTKNKPTAPGAYWVRGYHVSHRDDSALVEVREVDGELCSNLHNSNSDPRDPMPLADHSDRFEWCGPLVPANNTPQRMARPSAGATYAGGDGSPEGSKQ